MANSCLQNLGNYNIPALWQPARGFRGAFTFRVCSTRNMNKVRERGLASCAYIPEHTLTQLPTIVSRMRGRRMRVWNFPRHRQCEKARRHYSLLLFLCHVSNLEGPNGFNQYTDFRSMCYLNYLMDNWNNHVRTNTLQDSVHNEKSL